MRAPIVLPSRTDPLVRDATGPIGGPLGRLSRIGSHWLTPIRVLIGFTAIAYLLGYLLDLSCRTTGWASPERYEHLCYSDIAPLYSLRGFADGALPYLQTPVGQQPLEYPVLTGLFMFVAARVTTLLHAITPDVDVTGIFFDVNVVGLFVPLLIAVVALALTNPRRPWDAAMLALAPTVILAATINWDLLPLGFLGVALLLWSRSRPGWAGVLLGLAIAAKFYPVLLLGGFLVLSLRSGRWRAFALLVGGTAASWLVVNLPFMLGNFDDWWYFYSFSSERGQDFGSFWFALDQLGLPTVPAESLNAIGTGVLLLLCVGIAVLALRASRRPRLAQVLFLIIAAFVITNKVYSPQYVLWLVPLAIMARPRWRDLLVWQAGEVVYFVAIWWFLVGYGVEGTKGLTPQWYGAAVLVHIAVTVWFAALVVRDIVRPDLDPVRTDGFAEDADDPTGGPYDGAPDVVTLRGSSTH